MRIAARFGNSLHAPGNTMISLVSAYTSGADALDMMVQFTKDNQLVLSVSDAIKEITGEDKKISELNASELLGFDFSENFALRNSPDFSFYKKSVKGRRLPCAHLHYMLRLLPTDLPLLFQLNTESLGDGSRRDRFVRAIADTVRLYKLQSRCVFYSMDDSLVKAIKKLEPGTRIGLSSPAPNQTLLDDLEAMDGIGLFIPLESVLDSNLKPNPFGNAVATFVGSRGRDATVVIRPPTNQPPFTAGQLESLEALPWIWAVSTHSMLDIEDAARKPITLIDESFNGTKFDKTRFSLGYAKANKYARVFQDNGIHIEIKPYDGDLTIPADALQKRLNRIEDKLTYTAKDWPYYSGGGVGVLEGLHSDFVAEVDYTVETVTQATTLEMAVVNADPGAHRDEPPTSMRHKDVFFDPHGAPPFAGVEHDEDDGYRINWNLGTDYDNNQYGKPVGDGSALSGRMRLERRGPYFAAYYRNETDAHDWACVGVARNDSLNPCVYLRCVAKRWRQENELNPSEFMPIIPNHYIFKNLKIKLYV